jgi:hypothetical protein
MRTNYACNVNYNITVPEKGEGKAQPAPNKPSQQGAELLK